MSEDILKIIDAVAEWNDYITHPENMIFSIAVDEKLHIRELSYRSVLKGRNEMSKVRSVRILLPPSINYEASDYIELID